MIIKKEDIKLTVERDPVLSWSLSVSEPPPADPVVPLPAEPLPPPPDPPPDGYGGLASSPKFRMVRPFLQ